MTDSDLILIGEVAARSGFAASALRYYEREGLITLPDSRTPNRADWARLSRSWRARLDEQIAALEALRDGLTSCIGCGCLSLQRCALSNPGDRVGQAGPGARFLPAALRAGQPTGRRPESGVTRS